MIVVDTNVVSEVMLPYPAETVQRWMKSVPTPDLFTTSITLAEILFGVAILPGGRRRQQIHEAAMRVFAASFEGRVLPFDGDAAQQFAAISVERQRIGRPINKFDAQIVAIAASRGAAVATRDIEGFAGCGVALIDPWHP